MTARKVNIPLAELNLKALNPRLERRVQVCDFPDCPAEAEHRAPRSPPVGKYRDGGPRSGAEFFWFCRQHAREFNANYDYFDGWRQREIEAFTKNAVTGHRGTWQMSAGASADHRLAAAFSAADLGPVTSGTAGINDHFALFGRDKDRQRRPKLPSAVRRALAILDLHDTVSLQEIKMRYKQLVKRHHPDVNDGDKQAEEHFKKINEANSQLLNCGYF